LRYPSCSGKYSLSVPFLERFFDLALKGNGTPQQPAGFTGQITSNSFMKREFGKKLIVEYFPRWDLTHVLDTAGAYIPGHGTPTVILFGKNQKPVSSTIRTVLGIRGEPATPAEPAQGIVWQAILEQIDKPGSDSDWVSAADSSREKFHAHPWSIGGGGAAELKLLIDDACDQTILDFVEIKRKRPDIGFASFSGFDEVFSGDRVALRRNGFPDNFVLGYITGEVVRDWIAEPFVSAFAPYDREFNLIPLAPEESWARRLWSNKTSLRNIGSFDQTREADGQAWWSWYRWIPDRYRRPTSICFAHVATHNCFVLDVGGRVFNQHAPVIKLRKGTAIERYTSFTGVLNSSASCFWMKQVLHNKGSTVDQHGARQRTAAFEDFYEFDGTKIASFPVPVSQPLQLPTALVKYSAAMQAQSPVATTASWARNGGESFYEYLRSARDLTASHCRKLIAWQEELDWQVYEAYGLIEASDAVSLPEGEAMDAIPPDGIQLGERAFEIVLARRMAADEAQTTWFTRHGSTPITEIPEHWPAAYRELVERRIRRIENDSNIRLIEQPEYKRRWNTESWDSQFQRAATEWLLLRLETYFHGSERMVKGNDECRMTNDETADAPAHQNPPSSLHPQSTIFDPRSSFIAASRPHLVSAQQLAEVVQADPLFLEVAECLEGHSGFSVSALVQRLVEAESVPALPRDRYKDSGLRKREDWEKTWKLQRLEDAVEEEVRGQNPETREEELKKLVRKSQLEKVGEIAVPPKYGSGDFKKASYWKLRGKLDVPKERWISYPGAERDGDASLVIAWAGWDHLDQAKALAEYFLDAKDAHGWPPAKLKPLLAALADLLPWLKQWHNTFDPNYGMGLGDYFQGFLEEQCRALEMTVQEVDAVRFEPAEASARPPARKQAKKRGRKGAEDGGNESGTSEIFTA
jgi:hypothetical protein